MVTHEFAELAGLTGFMVTYMLKATGFPMVPKSTLLYKVNVEDAQGVEHEIEALGIDEITEFPNKISLDKAVHLFLQAPTISIIIINIVIIISVLVVIAINMVLIR